MGTHCITPPLVHVLAHFPLIDVIDIVRVLATLWRVLLHLPYEHNAQMDAETDAARLLIRIEVHSCLNTKTALCVVQGTWVFFNFPAWFFLHTLQIFCVFSRFFRDALAVHYCTTMPVVHLSAWPLFTAFILSVRFRLPKLCTTRSILSAIQ